MAKQEPVQPDAGIDGALWQAGQGWRALPVKPNTKVPLIAKWQVNATTDEATLRKWWRKWPDAWVGGATGPESGRICLDVDQHGEHDGVMALAGLATELGELPDTAGQKTPHGWHLFFAWPAEGEPITNAAGENLPAGLDVRGKGGYVVLAPSPGYVVLPGLLQEMPAGYLGALRGSQVKGEPPVGQGAQPTNTLAWLLGHPATEGGRNEWLTRVAGYLAKQTPFEDGFTEQVRVANLALQPPLEDEEVDKIAGSIWKAEQRKPSPTLDRTGRLTELGNAERFMQQHGEVLRYCEDWHRWLVWDGRRLATDATLQADAKMIETVKGLYREAGDSDDSSERKALTAWALKSESDRVIKGSLSRAKPMACLSSASLDSRAEWVNTRSGVYELDAHQLHPHRVQDHITKLAEVDVDPSARCPAWLAFLDRVLHGDAELINFAQRAAGYSMTADTSERAMFILYGGGRNGKSTFLNVLEQIMGDYAARTPVDTLMMKPDGTIPNDLARLVGVRLVIASEAEEGRQMAEAQIKRLTGNEKISARFMRAEWFDYLPAYKIWLATNHLPRVKSTDHATWDRLRLIPFTVRIPEDEIDRDLGAKLLAERAGIFNWMVEGCKIWQSEGLGWPEAVKQATASYQVSQDLLGQWLEEHIDQGPRLSELGSTLYGCWSGWCLSNGEKPSSNVVFAAALKERGFDNHKSDGKRVWMGLQMRQPIGQQRLEAE